MAVKLRSNAMNQNYDIIPIPVSIKGCDGRYIYVNKAWCEMFSLEIENALGFTDSELNLDPLSLPEGEKDAAIGEYSFRDVFVTTRDRGRLLLELIETRMDEAHGPAKIMCVHQDMTGVGWRMEDLTSNLQRCENSAKQSNQRVAEFIRNASEPAKQMIDICDKLGNTQLDSKQRGMLEILRSNARIIQKNVRINASTSIDVEPLLETGEESVLVEPMMAGVIKLYENVARDKNVSISMLVSDDFAKPVITDGSHMRQILVNMLESAIRSAEGGNVIMQASVSKNPNTPILFKVTVENPKSGGNNGGRSSQSDISLGLSHKILKGLCGIVGGRLEISSERNGSKNLKVYLPAKINNSGNRK
jgi:signal transduction histidine kinase